MTTKTGLGYTAKRDDFVEARKIDPRELSQPAPQGPQVKKFDPSKLQKIEAPVERVVSAEERQQATAEHIASRLKVERAEKKVAAPVKTSIDRRVTDELVSRLAEELGLVSPVASLFEVEVPVGEGMMKVSFRLPEQDDNLWAIGVMDAIDAADERYTLVRTEAQWSEYTSHLVSCACVLKIQDKWIWEHLDLADKINEVLPGWDGKSWRKIPATIRSIMAQSLYGVLGRLHSDVLFLIAQAIDKARVLPKAVKENPTKAV